VLNDQELDMGSSILIYRGSQFFRMDLLCQPLNKSLLKIWVTGRELFKGPRHDSKEPVRNLLSSK
jgi:hypothetical protein